MAEELSTFLVLLHDDNPDRVPGLWVTQADSWTNLARKCGLRFNIIDIYEFSQDPGEGSAAYTQWGGMKLYHRARITPIHAWARGLTILRNALDDFSHEQAQVEVQAAVTKLCEFLAERLQQPNAPHLEANEELIEMGGITTNAKEQPASEAVTVQPNQGVGVPGSQSEPSPGSGPPPPTGVENIP